MDTRQMRSSYVVIGVDIPDEVPCEEVSVSTLPKSWQSYPAPSVLQERAELGLSVTKQLF
jgi:hypothetical protein